MGAEQKPVPLLLASPLSNTFFHPQENDPIGGTYLFKWIEIIKYKNVPDMKERGLRVYASTEINDQNK